MPLAYSLANLRNARVWGRNCSGALDKGIIIPNERQASVIVFWNSIYRLGLSGNGNQPQALPYAEWVQIFKRPCFLAEPGDVWL